MAKLEYDEYGTFFEVCNKLADANEEFQKQFTTKNKVKDFKSSEYVKCTVLKGIFRVEKLNDIRNLVHLTELADPERVVKVAPKFVKKFKNNEKWINILYK